MKTGIHDLPFPDYLAAPGVSQSRLKLLSRSPAHLKYADEHPEPPTPDQILGTIVDTAVFDPGKLKTCHWVRPPNCENKKGEIRKWNANATEAKDWIAAHSDRPIISLEQSTDIEGMRTAIIKHPAAALALKEGITGKSLFSEDPDTGLQLKGRPDWMSGNAIVDLKTTYDASPSGFARTVANFGYAIQAAFYLDLANRLNLKKDVFLFIVVEKDAPYAVGVYQLDEASIEIGRQQYRRLLNRYMECVSTDSWPAYSRHVEFLSLPSWNIKQEHSAMLLENAPHVPALAIE